MILLNQIIIFVLKYKLVSEQRFNVPLIMPTTVGAWTYFIVPFNAVSVFGEEGHIKVIGTINDIPYRSIITPRGDGSHYMIVNKTIREQLKLNLDNTIEVVMQHDTEPRIVEIPAELIIGFQKSPLAQQKFEKLAYSNRKSFVDWINSPIKEKTKTVRAEKTIQMLLEGIKLKDK